MSSLSDRYIRHISRSMHMRNFILALTALLLLASCRTVSPGNVIAVATSNNPQAAARALLQSRKNAYMRNPVQLANDLKNVQRDFKNLMDILRGNAGRKWGSKEARLPDRTHYVKYTQGYLSRAIVDFDLGEITVETLDEKNSAASLKDAIVTTLLTPDDPRSVDLFSDSSIRLTGERDPYLLGLVLDDKGRAIATPQQAEHFAAGLVGVAQTRSVKTDAGSKQARFVKFPMVNNFSSKQAENTARWWKIRRHLQHQPEPGVRHHAHREQLQPVRGQLRARLWTDATGAEQRRARRLQARKRL